MAKYRVYLGAVVSCTVEVEADSFDEALEAVWTADTPTLNISNSGMDLGDWEPVCVYDPDGNETEVGRFKFEEF